MFSLIEFFVICYSIFQSSHYGRVVPSYRLLQYLTVSSGHQLCLLFNVLQYFVNEIIDISYNFSPFVKCRLQICWSADCTVGKTWLELVLGFCPHLSFVSVACANVNCVLFQKAEKSAREEGTGETRAEDFWEWQNSRFCSRWTHEWSRHWVLVRAGTCQKLDLFVVCHGISQHISSTDLRKHILPGSSSSSLKVNKCKSIAVTVQQYGENGEILHAGKWKWKKVSIKFMFKCRQCRWWRHFWRNLTEYLSRFLPPQHKRSTVWKHVCDMARSTDDAECKCCWPGRAVTCCRLSNIPTIFV